MGKTNFTQWCAEATAGIRYPPDREAVSAELRAHLEDHYDALLARGIPDEEARQQALEAMGEAKVIAPQLAAIHRPFWGWLYTVSKWMLIAAMITLVCFLISSILRTRIYQPDDKYYTQTELDYQERVALLPQDSAVTCEGYTFEVTQAALWHTTIPSGSGTYEYDTLHIQVQVTSPFPIAEASDAVRWFWAEDSLGNYYYSGEEHIHNLQQGLSGGRGTRTGLFTWTHELITDGYVSQEAQWLDLHYDRAGHDLVLRIDLTGGETP